MKAVLYHVLAIYASVCFIVSSILSKLSMIAIHLKVLMEATMVNKSFAFSGFSIKDIPSTVEFSRNKLGLTVAEEATGLHLITTGNNPIFMYHKENHSPATYTILNLPVTSIDEAVDALKTKGIVF